MQIVEDSESEELCFAPNLDMGQFNTFIDKVPKHLMFPPF